MKMWNEIFPIIGLNAKVRNIYARGREKDKENCNIINIISESNDIICTFVCCVHEVGWIHKM